MIEIRNGCKKYAPSASSTDQIWLYEDAKNAGILRYYFEAPDGVIPAIGDFINEETLYWVPRTEYKIVPNQEPLFPDEDEFTYRR
jgi:hypothetical protein